MKLIPKLLPDWPKLAWSAVFAKGSGDIVVYHGPMVEVADRGSKSRTSDSQTSQWVVEAVWAGEYAAGDFDRTDLVVGTGVRNRADRVVFVSSGTAVDRLWHYHHSGRFCVSNSLPALLATTDLLLRDDYPNYPRDIESIDETGAGLSGYVRELPSNSSPLKLLYFNNLAFDGTELAEIPKPDTAPRLRSFPDYLSFLTTTAEQIGANARSTDRKHKIVPLTTISSGYDSSAVAVVARRAGCDLAATISNSTSLWRGSDSGEQIARYLGLRCRAYRHTPRSYDCEEAIWAAIGRPRGLNLTVFDFPEPLCLFFTGNYGDKIWDLSYADVSEPTGDLSGLCICEFRLIKGVFHCMPAWWAVRHSRDIQTINHSEEMEPWALHNDYDRPIARRIIEEAGVPRGTFAKRKMNTSSEAPFWWPYSRQSQESFRRYLTSRGMYAPGPRWVWLIRRAAHMENLVYMNVTKKLGLKKRLRPWRRIAGTSLLFQWANHELKQLYRSGLEEASSQGGTSQAAQSGTSPVMTESDSP